MAITVTLNWLNKSQNLTGQKIYFGDEVTQTLLATIGPELTTYQHTLPPEVTTGIVHYRVASYVTTTDQGDVEESTTSIAVNLDANVGLIYHTETTGFQIISLTPFTVYFSDGSVINSTTSELQPGLNGQMINTLGVAGRTRIVPVSGNELNLLYIATRVDSIESWGGYIYNNVPSVTPYPLTINNEYLTGVPAEAPNCTNLSNLFSDAPLFNDPNVLTWDVSNVTTMESMFENATAFNQPIGVWDVSSVINFNRTFRSAISFSQDLSGWCLANITDPETQMVDTFIGTDAMLEIYKPVAGTCPRGEIDYLNITRPATHLAVGDSFTIGYSTNLDDTGRVWSVSDPAIATITDGLLQGVAEGTVTVTLTIGAFTKTTDVIVKIPNAPLVIVKGTDTSVFSLQVDLDGRQQLTLMVDFGDGTPQEELVLTTGSVDSLTIYRSYGDTTERTITIYCPWESLPNLTAINGVTSVTQWPGEGWTSFRLGGSIVSVPNSIPSNVTNLSNMFYESYIFNQDISMWDVSNVTNMMNMFAYANNFNQNLSSWNTGKVTNMQGMFLSATAFNQDLSQWCVWNTMNVDFGTNSGLAPENYPVWGTCPRNEVPAPPGSAS